MPCALPHKYTYAHIYCIFCLPAYIFLAIYSISVHTLFAMTWRKRDWQATNATNNIRAVAQKQFDCCCNIEIFAASPQSCSLQFLTICTRMRALEPPLTPAPTYCTLQQTSGWMHFYAEFLYSLHLASENSCCCFLGFYDYFAKFDFICSYLLTFSTVCPLIVSHMFWSLWETETCF